MRVILGLLIWGGIVAAGPIAGDAAVRDSVLLIDVSDIEQVQCIDASCIPPSSESFLVESVGGVEFWIPKPESGPVPDDRGNDPVERTGSMTAVGLIGAVVLSRKRQS